MYYLNPCNILPQTIHYTTFNYSQYYLLLLYITSKYLLNYLKPCSYLSLTKVSSRFSIYYFLTIGSQTIHCIISMNSVYYLKPYYLKTVNMWYQTVQYINAMHTKQSLSLRFTELITGSSTIYEQNKNTHNSSAHPQI